MIKQGKTVEMKAGIFNKGGLSGKVALKVDCAGAASAVNATSIGQIVPKSDARAYKLVLNAPKGGPTVGSYPCTVSTNTTAPLSRQSILEVTN